MKSKPILDPDTTYRNFDWLYLQRVVLKRKISDIAKECGVHKSTIEKALVEFNIKSQKNYTDKTWLETNLVFLSKSIVDLAAECDVDENTIRTWAKKLNINTERGQQTFKNKDWMYNQCVIQEKSVSLIAKECGVRHSTISEQIKYFNIINKRVHKLDEKLNYNNKDWLFNQRINFHKSYNDIAKECGVDKRTIKNRLKRFNIPINDLSVCESSYKNERWMWDQYCSQKKSAAQIAKENKWNVKTVLKYLKTFNVDVKKRKVCNTKILNPKSKKIKVKFTKEYKKIKREERKRASSEERKERRRESRKRRSYKIKEYHKEYRIKNIDIIKYKSRVYQEKHKYEAKLRSDKHYRLIKDFVYDLLGRECSECGEKDPRVLSFDHIKNNGSEERNGSKSNNAIFKKIKDGVISVSQARCDYRIVCFNCHYSEDRRKYMDLPLEELTKNQKYILSFWKEAFDFFGPCPCGISDLKFLTIDHIHRDGAERRRNGEKVGAALIREFKKMGWPESLKEGYRLACWNCNCGRNR